MQLAILQSVPLHVTGSCLSRGSKEDESVNLWARLQLQGFFFCVECSNCMGGWECFWLQVCFHCITNPIINLAGVKTSSIKCYFSGYKVRLLRLTSNHKIRFVVFPQIYTLVLLTT